MLGWRVSRGRHVLQPMDSVRRVRHTIRGPLDELPSWRLTRVL
jgi:hypothetical protein